MRPEHALRRRAEELAVGVALLGGEGRRALGEEAAVVEAVHELQVQRGLTDAEERVEEGPAALAQVHHVPPVERLDLVHGEASRAVHGRAHVPEAVHF